MDGNISNVTTILTYTGAHESAPQATRDARAVDVLEALRRRGLCLLSAGNDFYLIRDLLYRRRQSRRITRKALSRSSGLSVNAIRTIETRAGDCTWDELLKLLHGVLLDTTVGVDTDAVKKLVLSVSSLSTLTVFTDRCPEHETTEFRGGAEILRVHNGGSYFSLAVWTGDEIREGWEIEGNRLRVVPWSGDGGPAFCQALPRAGERSAWRERPDLEAALAEADTFLQSVATRFIRPNQFEEEIEEQIKASLTKAVEALGLSKSPRASNSEEAAAIIALIEFAPMLVKTAHEIHKLVGDRMSLAELAAYHARLWEERLPPYKGSSPFTRSDEANAASVIAGPLELVRLAVPVGAVPERVREVFGAVVDSHRQAASTIATLIERLRESNGNS